MLALAARGLMRIATLAGFVFWLAIALIAALAAANAVDADTEFDQAARSLANAIGVIVLLVGSVLALRTSGRWGGFLLSIACGALMCAYGFGALQGLAANAPPLWMLGAGLGVLIVAAFAAGALNDMFARFAGIALVVIAALALPMFGVLSQFGAAPPMMGEQTSPALTAPAPALEEDNTAALIDDMETDAAAPPAPIDALPAPSASLGGGYAQRGRADAGAPAPLAEAPASAQEQQMQPDASQFVLEELRFNRPERMRINRPVVLEAQIGAPLQQTLGSSGATVSREVEIPSTRLVRVELISDDFTVEKLHRVDEQLIAPGASGLWSWRVTPEREGDARRLLLQVYGVLRQAGYEGQVLVRTYEESIPVDVTPMDRAQMVAQGFLSRWDLVGGVAGAIGGIWVFLTNLLKLFRRRELQAA